MNGIKFEQLPIRCRYCDYLGCFSLYMDGSADYICRKPTCDYREKFKEAIRKAREERKLI